MDFKDVSSVSPKESLQGKLKHVIEVCDAGGRRNLCGDIRAGQRRFP